MSEEEEFVVCPICKIVMNWMLSITAEDGWLTTYGCENRCQEPAKITFGDKK